MGDTKVTLEQLALWLEREFAHWEYLYQYGGSDPSHEDGVNLDLTRNHISSYKRQMDEYMSREAEELTLFRSTYPDIYYRETPPELPKNYMARPDEIRARAEQQLALYEQDPNFCYIRDHYYEVFPDGHETRATRAAGLSPTQGGPVVWYREILKRDSLVHLRSIFHEPYEEKAVRWGDLAQKMKAYLSVDHSKEDSTPVKDFYEDEECADDLCVEEEDLDTDDVPPPSPTVKLSLEEQIRQAKSKAESQVKPSPQQEIQMTLF